MLATSKVHIALFITRLSILLMPVIIISPTSRKQLQILKAEVGSFIPVFFMHLLRIIGLVDVI